MKKLAIAAVLFFFSILCACRQGTSGETGKETVSGISASSETSSETIPDSQSDIRSIYEDILGRERIEANEALELLGDKDIKDIRIAGFRDELTELKNCSGRFVQM